MSGHTDPDLVHADPWEGVVTLMSQPILGVDIEPEDIRIEAAGAEIADGMEFPDGGPGGVVDLPWQPTRARSVIAYIDALDYDANEPVQGEIVELSFDDDELANFLNGLES